MLNPLADHEAGDVLQKDQWNFAPITELHEMRAFLRGLRKQDAVVRDNAHGIAVYMCKPADERRTVKLLELLKLGAVNNPRDDFAHVVRKSILARDDAVDILSG